MEKSARPRTALNECVKVVVRCRPLSEREKNEGYEEVVKVWPERGAVQVYNPKGQDKLFTYDAAYDCTADTQTMYDEMVRPLVASVLDGFNGCVFAYGQTGTGKTHTMEGTAEHEGVIPRAFRHMWAHIENSASPDVTHLVSCSYIELYLEDVRDLLAKDCKKLTIRGQELNGFYIPEMTSVVCKSAAEMVRVMRAGNRNRAAGRTDMNEHSSRSHAVFLVTVETAHRKTNRIRVGKLNLVDLAGSERQRKTGASAERLREASRINQALSSLGNVISALAENSPHVPYRDSKLTRILQDSLGGNSKTIMIANIGPASYNYDETITTLRYAHRAKAIKNKPVRNEDPKDAKLREYQAEIERLRLLIEQRRVVDKKPKRPAKPRPQPTDNSEEETVSIENENILAESTIEQEKNKTEELEHQIRALEERLVQGGGGKDLINNLNETQLILEQRNSEIAERKKREVEMQQKIELEEETATIVTNTFTTLQQEVDHKTQRRARPAQARRRRSWRAWRCRGRGGRARGPPPRTSGSGPPACGRCRGRGGRARGPPPRTSGSGPPACGRCRGRGGRARGPPPRTSGSGPPACGRCRGRGGRARGPPPRTSGSGPPACGRCRGRGGRARGPPPRTSGSGPPACGRCRGRGGRARGPPPRTSGSGPPACGRCRGRGGRARGPPRRCRGSA
ncbi:kinesin-like protein Klp68D isoform X3 [Trichoplusia ni]|uniref:Kinesin-like protein n=1 Tax=Trichoplusia ni TaxID=7111 RepID=A0A7E5WJL6_TRINI|nr:kinesin-like protein Klp68D isoform X3 [Trichoplusia ni]